MYKPMIRAMDETEYDEWRAYSGKNYAAEKRKEGLSEADAQAESDKSFERLLPQRGATPDQHLYAVVNEASGERLGALWWGVQKQGTKRVAWIYDIELAPAMRGKGLGRATMNLAVTDAKAKGFDRLGLHVFGHNQVAQGLYKSMGFAATNVVMYKDI